MTSYLAKDFLVYYIFTHKRFKESLNLIARYSETLKTMVKDENQKRKAKRILDQKLERYYTFDPDRRELLCETGFVLFSLN